MWIWESEKWPTFYWNDTAITHSLFEAQIKANHFLAKMQCFSKQHQSEAEAEVLMEDSIHTSLIEGEILARESVRSSVFYHLGLDDKNTPNRPIDGLVKILLDARKNHAIPLSHERLWGWHAALFPSGYSGLSKITVGQYREQKIQIISGHFDRIKVHFEAPPASILSEEMTQFIHWFNTESLTLNGIIRAALAHLYFEVIHPFDDGNGRLGRAILDLALAQFEQEPKRYYSISTAIEKNRRSYYSILEKTSSTSSLDLSEYLLWFIDIFTQAITHSENMLQRVLRKAHFWQQHAETELSARQRKVLNKMLDKDAFIGGMTTRKYMALTQVSRATAFREISDLLSKACLVPIANSQGRNQAYELLFPNS